MTARKIRLPRELNEISLVRVTGVFAPHGLEVNCADRAVVIEYCVEGNVVRFHDCRCVFTAANHVSRCVERAGSCEISLTCVGKRRHLERGVQLVYGWVDCTGVGARSAFLRGGSLAALRHIAGEVSGLSKSYCDEHLNKWGRKRFHFDYKTQAAIRYTSGRHEHSTQMPLINF